MGGVQTRIKDGAVRFPSGSCLKPTAPAVIATAVSSVDREATPKPAMKLGIRLRLAETSLSYILYIIDIFDSDRRQSTVYNRVWKVELQFTDGADPDHVAVDETVIRLSDKRF